MINYSDFFSQTRWPSFINNSYINLTSPTIKVFKLDKVRTKIDPIYNEEETLRVYLKPFDLKAYHLDNRYQELLGLIPYQRSEQPLQLIINFDNMVNEIKKLKEEETVYKNISDVIEIGDAILTNKYLLYEVRSAMPSGDFLFDFVTWQLTCEVEKLDKIILPENYRDLVKQKQKELGYYE